MSKNKLNDEYPPIYMEEKKNIENANCYSEWIELQNKSFYPTTEIIKYKKLPSGIYDIDWDGKEGKYFFKQRNLALDELINLPDPTFEQILTDIEYFWNNENKFIEYNFAYKRGILLYGPPGNGKTSLTALLSNYLITKKNGVVFTLKNGNDLDLYAHAIPDCLRTIEKNTPILTLIEDLDGILAYKENETLLLNILDGFKQINNAVYIGCTNYPEQLKDRILNRPSRFDKRYCISNPIASVRKFYFENKIKKEDLSLYDIDYIVKKTEGLSLSHLSELIKSVYIFGKDLDKSIEELNNMSTFISSTQYDNNKKTGFLRS